ncbi:MAG: GIY-YIG nuclease family protein [Patescibacteria group bacterium]
MYYVYVLQSLKDGKLYIGYTADLRQRFQEHQQGHSRATAYRRPWHLSYYEAYDSVDDARARERQLKRFKSAYGQLKKRLTKSLKLRYID